MLLFFAWQHVFFCGVSSLGKDMAEMGLAMSDDVRVFRRIPPLFDTGTAKAAPFTYGVARSHEILHGGTKHKDVP